jgi:hypothetical protein
MLSINAMLAAPLNMLSKTYLPVVLMMRNNRMNHHHRNTQPK